MVCLRSSGWLGHGGCRCLCLNPSRSDLGASVFRAGLVHVIGPCHGRPGQDCSVGLAGGHVFCAIGGCCTFGRSLFSLCGLSKTGIIGVGRTRHQSGQEIENLVRLPGPGSKLFILLAGFSAGISFFARSDLAGVGGRCALVLRLGSGAAFLMRKGGRERIAAVASGSIGTGEAFTGLCNRSCRYLPLQHHIQCTHDAFLFNSLKQLVYALECLFALGNIPLECFFLRSTACLFSYTRPSENRAPGPLLFAGIRLDDFGTLRHFRFSYDGRVCLREAVGDRFFHNFAGNNLCSFP